MSSEINREAAIMNRSETVTMESPTTEVRESYVSVVTGETRSVVDNCINDGLSTAQFEDRLSEKLERPEVQRLLIQEFSPYSDQINNHVRSLAEIEIYQSQNLQETVVHGRPCLTAEIDPQQTDAMGTTNAERMASGRAPVDENGNTYHLHHIGQKETSPLAELKAEVHQKFDSVLHDKTISSEVHGEGNNWNSQRIAHWSERSTTIYN